MRRNNNIKYTYKQIGGITFPILISLLMEMMIGVTDTAFLGCLLYTSDAADE